MRKLASSGVIAVVSCFVAWGGMVVIADFAEAGGDLAAVPPMGGRDAVPMTVQGQLPKRSMSTESAPHALLGFDESRSHFRSGATGGCRTLPPEPWFTVVRRLPDCMRLAVGQFTGEYDVDGNGEPEWLSRIYYAQSGECAVSEVVYSIVQGEVVATTRCVLDATILVDFAATEVPGGQYCCIAELTFIDVDHDGDRDAVMNLVVEGSRVPCWVENTGFEAAPPRVADINRDGNVDAADLSLLLADWG